MLFVHYCNNPYSVADDMAEVLSLFSRLSFLLKCAEGLMRNDKQSPQVAGELFVKAFDPQSSVQIIALSEQRACVNRVCVLTEICVNING